MLYWLVENVSKGGNFLLNVGPDGQGVIPTESADILKEAGQWLAVNGEAIYGSKPWDVNHEGPTKIDIKGTKYRQDNQVTFDFTDKDFWFTEKENKLYAISFAWPKNNKVLVASLHVQNIKSIRTLGQKGRVQWKQTSKLPYLLIPIRNLVIL